MVDEELYVAAEALLLQGLPGTVSRELDDENRIIPLAFDIDHDMAVTAFLCWLLEDEGPMPGLEMVTAFRDHGAWVAVGSSAGPASEPAPARPAVPTRYGDPAFAPPPLLAEHAAAGLTFCS